MSVTVAGEEPALRGLRELVASKDWSATALGPIAGWSEALRTTVETCLGSRFPVIIFWGPELVQVYNDAYAPIIGAKHPQALGQTAEQCFPEIWDVIGPMLHGVLDSGQATWSDDLLLMLERNGFPEECYFTFSYSPAGGAPVQGVFCAVIETSRRVIGERRFNLLSDLSSGLAGARHTADVLDKAVDVLGQHPSDLPAGLLRRQAPDGSEDDRWWSTSGPGDGHAVIGESAATVIRTGGHLVRGWGGTGQRYQPGMPAVAAYAIDRPGAAGPVAALAVELNAHLPFDDAYEDFLALVASAISAAAAGAESYQEAERRASALEELDRAKTSLLSNVSHEFRTPLTLLLAPLQDYMADSRLPDDVRRGLALAERNARRLLKLVNNLLDFARLEAGRASPTFVATDLSALTANSVSVFRSAAESAGLELVVDCPPLPEPVHVDRDMWEQIVTNLCANAVKFTPHGSVVVRLRAVGADARLEVRDTGVGIAAEDLPLVFDRFRRAPTAGARSFEGTGIGLALVRELVALHGGQVRADSQPGAGTTFTVTVPLGTGHLPADQVGTETAAVTRSTPAAPADVVASLETLLPSRGPSADPVSDAAAGSFRDGPVVFVIDDNADMRSYLVELLGRHWQVVGFADARAALTAIETRQPDLVLSDVMMPGMDGFDFLAELRARPATAQLPVLLLSARAGEEAFVEGLEAGADDYLVKPFTSRSLLARVRSHLDLAALRRDGAERTARHAAQLASLATAATDIVCAETVEEISTVVELSARQVTGAAECQLHLDTAAASGGGLSEFGSGHIAVPLPSAAGRPVGVLRLRHRPGTFFRDEDYRLITELARIAGSRIERIRQYQREHQLADTLQRSLLPRTLPSVGGVELAARYLPASEAAAVGGDWYDALALEDGQLMLVVGDVIGHDLSAAVAMGQLRHLLRGHAIGSADPAELCETVNRLLPALGTGEMATAAVAFLDPRSGTVSLTSAGHPPPVIVERSGRARLVDIAPCPPLGALEGAAYHTEAATLEPGATLIFYTDGLVERRGEPIDVSMAKLVERCGRLRGSSLDTALDGLLDETLSGSLASDDIAVLAVRRYRSDQTPGTP